MLKKLLLLGVFLLSIFLYFNYRRKPILPNPYESGCPYYRDILGRFFLRIKTGGLFVFTRDVTVWNYKKTIDSDKFTILTKENRCYGTDGKDIFYNIWKIENADIQSWEYLGGNYSKDNNNVYYDNKVLSGLNPSEFTFIYPTSCKNNEIYARKHVKDFDHVWYNDKMIPEADAASFKVFCKPGDGNLYGMDKRFRYKEGEVVQD